MSQELVMLDKKTNTFDNPLIGGCKIHIKLLDLEINQENVFLSNPYLRFCLIGNKKSTIKILNEQQSPTCKREFDLISTNCAADILKIDMIEEDIGFQAITMEKIEIRLRDHNYGEHYIFNKEIIYNNKKSGKLHFEIDFMLLYETDDENNNDGEYEINKKYSSNEIKQLVHEEESRILSYKEKIKRLSREENANRILYEENIKNLMNEEKSKRQEYEEKVKQLEDEANACKCNEYDELDILLASLVDSEPEKQEPNVNPEKQSTTSKLGSKSSDSEYGGKTFARKSEGKPTCFCITGNSSAPQSSTKFSSTKFSSTKFGPKAKFGSKFNSMSMKLNEEAEAQKRAEKEAEEKRLAEEAETDLWIEMLLADEAETQICAEEDAEAKQMIEEALSERLAEEFYLERLLEAESQRLVEETEAKRLAKEAEAQKRAEEEAEARRQMKIKLEIQNLAEEEKSRQLDFQAKMKKLVYEEELRRIAYKEKIKRLEYEEDLKRLSYKEKIKRLSYAKETEKFTKKEEIEIANKDQKSFSIWGKQDNSIIPSIKKTNFELVHDFSDMDDNEKLEYFNNLVNDESENRFAISIQEFYNLTCNIHKVNEKQFDYMIEYYKYLQMKGNDECKLVFINLESLTIPMTINLLKLKDFSLQYLSDKVLRTSISNIFLYENLFNEVGQLCFLNERLAYNEIDNENQRDNSLKKTKKIYYTLFDQINDEIRIFEGSKIVESHLFDGYDIEKVIIPSSAEIIQDNAFYRCKYLTSVSLEGINLTKIGKSAFSGCENLRTFVIPEKVEVIEEFTFKNCKRLEKVIFPKELKEIKEKAFIECKSLTEIKLPKSIEKVGSGAFKKCKSLKLFIIPDIIYIYPDGYNIGSNSEDHSSRNFSISSKCFAKCESLQNLTICDNCQNIEDSAFSSCSNLQKVTFALSPDSKIGNYAFQECTSIRKVNFILTRESTLNIGKSSFQNCIKLNEVNFDQPDLFPENSFKLDSSVFKGCENLSTFEFPKNCEKEIGESCFDGCTNLKSVTLPTNLAKINTSMFRNCKNLNQINIENSDITVIGNNSFENCINLKMEKLPSYLTKIGKSAFKNCCLLNIKAFPDQIEEICENSFENCQRFTEISFPESMRIIHRKAFSECSQLSKVTNYSASLTIKKKAFYKCRNLKEVFTNNKEEFSTEAFEECAQGLDFFKIEN